MKKRLLLSAIAALAFVTSASALEIGNQVRFDETNMGCTDAEVSDRLLSLLNRHGERIAQSAIDSYHKSPTKPPDDFCVVFDRVSWWKIVKLLPGTYWACVEPNEPAKFSLTGDLTRRWCVWVKLDTVPKLVPKLDTVPLKGPGQ